jgi:hypothetical protein
LAAGVARREANIQHRTLNIERDQLIAATTPALSGAICLSFSDFDVRRWMFSVQCSFSSGYLGHGNEPGSLAPGSDAILNHDALP